MKLLPLVLVMRRSLTSARKSGRQERRDQREKELTGGGQSLLFLVRLTTTQYTALNRDKPLQWMIFKNGEVGFVGEHSCMDGMCNPLASSGSICSCVPNLISNDSLGTPTARMCDFISKRLITNQPVAIGANDAAPTSTPSQTLLPFELDSKSLGYIKTATKEFQDHVGGFDLLHTSYERYGKEGIKQMKTSPDGWCASFLFLDIAPSTYI